MNEFTHMKDEKIDMVDITEKPDSYRIAIAKGEIKLKEKTIEAIKKNKIEKGNVETTSKIAGIQAIKNTPNQIPLCHNIPITDTEIEITAKNKKMVVKVRVKTTAKTGVEMEALNGVSTTLLTIWDMVKSNEKNKKGQYPDTEINNIKVIEKIKKQKNDS